MVKLNDIKTAVQSKVPPTAGINANVFFAVKLSIYPGKCFDLEHVPLNSYTLYNVEEKVKFPGWIMEILYFSQRS